MLVSDSLALPRIRCNEQMVPGTWQDEHVLCPPGDCQAVRQSTCTAMQSLLSPKVHAGSPQDEHVICPPGDCQAVNVL